MENENIQVIVVGSGINRKEDLNAEENEYSYQGIRYINTIKEERLYKKIIDWDKRLYDFLVTRYSITKKDYMILYEYNYMLMRWACKHVGREHVSVCQVELFQSYQFKLGCGNPKYLLKQMAYQYVKKNQLKVLPISSFIAHRYKKTKCKSLVLPIMSDPYEYENRKNHIIGQVVKFIYPGIKKTDYEDDIPTLLVALQSLEQDETQRLEIHFTGITKEEFLKRYCVTHKDIIKQVVFHGWMEYSELIELYKEMDYIILVRKINDITRANFPSKIPEIMAYGVVPICTEVGDYTEFYLKDGENSLFIAGEGGNSCSETIKRAINIEPNDYVKMSDAAKKVSQESFYYKIWSERIIRFLS